MKKHKLPVLLVMCCMYLISCNSDSPEKYFDIAVLNTNALRGFAGDGMLRDLQSPSVKMAENNGKPVPMKRSEVLNAKIKLAEENLDKLEGMKKTDDNKDMLEASLALYKFVIPVYKTEYTQLAGLYDANAQEDEIESLAKLIHEKYYSEYTELYNKLISIGKVYAEKHDIKVNWGAY
jgi:hypothetical protein